MPTLLTELPNVGISAEVAQVAAPRAAREARLQAAQGRLRLPATEYLVALLLLCRDSDPEVRRTAVATVRRIPAERLNPLLTKPGFPARLVDFLARARCGDAEVLAAVLASPALSLPTMLFLAARPDADVLAQLADCGRVGEGGPELREVLAANPALTPALRQRLLPAETPAPDVETPETTVEEDESSPQEIEEVEEEHLSKYQLVLELGVADKIKLALTGDKEWRNLLIKDANKLVNSAVVKNPRITEAEVVTLARNRSATDDQIRLITLNREWMKNYEIRRALVMHPRTPLPNALRYMSGLSEKDLKTLAKSRGVSAVIVNQARRMLSKSKH